jgi:UDP-glucose 4-epimerase
MNNKNVLLVGGAGYIGNHIFLSLFNEGFSPIIVDNLSNSYKYKIDNLAQYTKSKIIFIDADINHKHELQEIFDEYNICSVIHLAALKSVPESDSNYINYYQNNICGLINILDVMKFNNVKKIIFSSSATVYGENATPPVKETMPVFSNNTYGFTKIIGEDLIKNICKVDNSWSALILRYFNPAGSVNAELFSEDPKSPGGNLFPLIAACFDISNKGEFNIYGDDYDTLDGTPVRDFIHVEDLADAHVCAVKKVLAEGNYCKVINVGSGNPKTVLEIVRKFEEITQIKLNINFKERRQNDIESSFANIELAKHEIGFIPKHNLDSICKSCLVSE